MEKSIGIGVEILWNSKAHTGNETDGSLFRLKDEFLADGTLGGVEVAGQRYYYRVMSGASFDPLSAGQAGRYETVAVLDQGTPWEVQIYQIAK